MTLNLVLGLPTVEKLILRLTKTMLALHSTINLEPHFLFVTTTDSSPKAIKC